MIILQSLFAYIPCINEWRFQMRDLSNFSLQNIYTTDAKTLQHEIICTKSINNAFKRGSFTMFIIGFTLGYALACLSYDQLLNGTYRTLTSTRIPFVDDDSMEEYFINLALQTIILNFGFLGNVLLEMCSLTVTDTVKLSAQLTRAGIECFSFDLENKMKFDHRTQLLHIFHQISRMDELMKISFFHRNYLSNIFWTIFFIFLFQLHDNVQ